MKPQLREQQDKEITRGDVDSNPKVEDEPFPKVEDDHEETENVHNNEEQLVGGGAYDKSKKSSSATDEEQGVAQGQGKATTSTTNEVQGVNTDVHDEEEAVVKQNKTVITFGTFDLFHLGHLLILDRAAAFGNRLVVGVSSDALTLRKKGKKPIFDEAARVQLVKSLKCVDEVFIEHSLEEKRQYCIEHEASIFIMGDDHLGRFDTMLKGVCECHYLPRTKGVSSTDIEIILSERLSKTGVLDKAAKEMLEKSLYDSLISETPVKKEKADEESDSDAVPTPTPIVVDSHLPSGRLVFEENKKSSRLTEENLKSWTTGNKSGVRPNLGGDLFSVDANTNADIDRASAGTPGVQNTIGSTSSTTQETSSGSFNGDMKIQPQVNETASDLKRSPSTATTIASLPTGASQMLLLGSSPDSKMRSRCEKSCKKEEEQNKEATMLNGSSQGGSQVVGSTTITSTSSGDNTQTRMKQHASCDASATNLVRGQRSTSDLTVTRAVDSLMYFLVYLHDVYYLWIQYICSPLCRAMPREVAGVTVFSANAVTYARTMLTLVICFLLKCGSYPYTAAFLVMYHDFLDHVDGVVAKVQREDGRAAEDDARWGGFVDAQCDKIVFCTCLWTLIILNQVPGMGENGAFLGYSLMVTCFGLILMELAIAWVRTRDYFQAVYCQNAKTQGALRAISEGKLKQKMESCGVAVLCLIAPTPCAFPATCTMGIALLWVGIYFAYKSLEHKLRHSVSA
ncbi:unnamed protein product [Amoebophrya sp. A25]|nr:unnamed protein product [Amoebophrya sp. A25]|eukprot:GSA25T00002615001.1